MCTALGQSGDRDQLVTSLPGQRDLTDNRSAHRVGRCRPISNGPPYGVYDRPGAAGQSGGVCGSVHSCIGVHAAGVGGPLIEPDTLGIGLRIIWL